MLSVLVFHQHEVHGLQAVRIKKDGGRTITTAYKPLQGQDERSAVRDGEVWVCDISADPYWTMAGGLLLIANAIPVLQLEPLGTSIVLDLAEFPVRVGGVERRQWQARQSVLRDTISIQYVLDRESPNQPAGPQEAGRYSCFTTKVIWSRCDRGVNDQVCAEMIVAVRIESRVVTSRGARRQKSSGMPVLVA
ncbi:MAG: hypothetical protein V1704_03380 [Candidatus Vogelbacteria bacterium]